MTTYRIFDFWTLKHLDAWLEKQFDGDEYRATIRAYMLKEAEKDPEYWAGQSWWNLFDRARCDLIERY